MIITLQWPSRNLSPNARPHWAVKAKAAKLYHEYGYIAARKEMINNKSYKFNDKITLDIKFYPKDKRRRDLDNCLASIKHGLDGIAQALGVDDSCFALKLEMMEDYKHKITVEIF
jgi:crossover junction endodeoxyribonuclease RusA